MNIRVGHYLLTGFILTAFLTTNLVAQVPNLTFEHLSVKDGLPSSDVYSITKDPQGFMWLGTRRCPTRYDGSTFRPFLFPETYLVTGITTDSAGRVWFASDRRGICHIDPKTFRLISVTGTPRTTGYLYKDAYGNGWFGDEKGIGRIDFRTGKVTTYPLRQTTYKGVKAYGFLEDKQHTLWAIGADNGLFRFDRQKNQFVCVLGLDCTNPRYRFLVYLSRGCIDADGVLWLGTYGRGLLRVDPRRETFTFFNLARLQNHVTCVQEGYDENGRRLLWVGDQQGLLVFRPEQRRFFRLSDIHSGPFYVHCLYRDPAQGILWMGTSNGLFKYNPQENLIRTIALPPGLVKSPVQINTITADQRDSTGQTFWLGLSHTGFVRWNRLHNQFSLIRYPNPSSETKWLVQTDDGRLWIGLRRWDYKGDGVLVHDPRLHRFVPNLAARRVGKLFSVPFIDHGLIDNQHRLWVGNNDEGLRVLDTRTGQLFRYWTDEVIRNLHRNNNLLTGIKMDQKGCVWLGMYQGVYRVDPTTHQFIRFDRQTVRTKRPDDLATNDVLINHTGQIWAARWGSVTESNPDGTFRQVLTAQNGFLDRENRQLIEDQTGTIWIGNYEGLYAYKPSSHRLFRFTTAEGLSRNNITGALYIHQGRELFIGQQNGMNYLDTRNVDHPVKMPPVVISSFRVHDQERFYDYTRPIQLDRFDNAFSVDFASLTYDRTSNMQYAYFLEGLDTRWHYSGQGHRASYTNLTPGQYTLRLKAADAFENWRSAPVSLSIYLLPAFYETWWFRLLVGLVIVGSFYVLYQYRVNQLLQLQRIRNNISADLHDEIGSSLSGIGILGTMARQVLPDEHPSKSMIGRIVSEARLLSGSLDDIVWSINPRNDALSILIARMNRYASELFEASGVTYTISIPDMIAGIDLPMEKRRNFYLVFKESVNNLIKHAQATQASITMTLTAKRLRLEISDNGKGFDATEDTDRNGLRNMRSRTQNLQGTLVIHTAPGQGTRLVLEFPMT